MTNDSKDKARTGVAGLDEILSGGLTRRHVFLLEGSPGTGKTTIALQFLREGAAIGERCLYITLSETEEELRSSSASHELELGDSIEIFELVPPESLLDADQQQSLLYSSDLELGETTKMIFEAFDRLRPSRVVIDSLSEIRLLAQSSLRYRRQILAMKHFFAKSGATVLLLDDMTSDIMDKTVHSVVHGVVHLEQMAPDYGSERRRLRIVKYRGQAFRGGYHDFVIKTGGVVAFPRLRALEHRTDFQRTTLASGVAELDGLLGGGVERGSSTLLIGPSGTGKTLFGLQFVDAAVKRGERAAVFVFDEELGLLFDRMKALGINLEKMRDDGAVHIEQLDAAEVSPGEFAQRVRDRVSDFDAKIVVLDSINGYQTAMPEENALILHMHELLQFLNRQGATTFLTVAQHGLVGDMKSPVDVTYLADTVVLLRYFEALGKIRRAVSVIKKRTGKHEETIREFTISESGLTLGDPLSEFQGVLRGIPSYMGKGEELLSQLEDDNDS
ncbi:ATPase domain-containing protein [Rhizobium grahamii]|uniref:non-specific serine/threonine protein kinase n=1 Tax=Rhizobium grahamii TaxID=1120045 RepID=A0A370KG98_9HYPH|nr:ATPase domain-containing protein [Rhizobium grahamii]RDJ03808.1 circadian clock protein KaiC [Rhizobium grahamii]